ncbi:MAG: acylphosphatase [Thaumarchaeota archaeon]|nr:acylphosphatase [Candidatus Geocrenenecus arthurdayi]
MVKANIRIYGSVQAVGYRVFVKNVARLMNVRGLVRNLEDGSVEVFAEAEEDTLEKFLKAIDIKGRPGDMLSLNVERIEVRREGEPGYTGPWRTYSLFEIDYGEEAIRPIEREMVESLEWAKIYFTKLVSEFTDYRQEFRDYRDEFRDFRSEFKDFRGEFRDFREEFRGFRSESLKISSEILSELKDFREEFRAFRDESLKISSETLNEVRELRRDLKAILDERLVKIEKDVAEIKARLGLL